MTPSASILVVDDDADLLRLMTMRLTAAGHTVQAVASAEAALAHLAVKLPSLLITDVRLPGLDGMALFDEVRARHPSLPVILLTAHGSIPDAVEATARGAHAYLTKPFDGQELMAKIHRALMVNAPGPARFDGDGAWRREIVSRSPRMAEVLAEARLVAGTDASVLISGDSGTGKELLARALHNASPRAARPFVAVNCAAIPEALLESELFGHVKGAFTGAQGHRQGLIPAAHGGTVFLDEIGDMPPSLQVKLLRVLQERVVRPVGSNEPVAVDVRVLSATHRDLELAMAEGQFRPDLFYRLNVVKLRLPPLSERREDVALLAQHFLQLLAERHRKPVKGFAPEALEALVTAPWPGNVRQLYNVVEQVCVLATGTLVPLAQVQRALQMPAADVLSYQHAKQRFERDYLNQLLTLTSGHVAEAARLADRNRTEFYRLMQKHGLDPQRYRTDPLATASDFSDTKRLDESST